MATQGLLVRATDFLPRWQLPGNPIPTTELFDIQLLIKHHLSRQNRVCSIRIGASNRAYPHFVSANPSGCCAHMNRHLVASALLPSSCSQRQVYIEAISWNTNDRDVLEMSSGDPWLLRLIWILLQIRNIPPKNMPPRMATARPRRKKFTEQESRIRNSLFTEISPVPQGSRVRRGKIRSTMRWARHSLSTDC